MEFPAIKSQQFVDSKPSKRHSLRKAVSAWDERERNAEAHTAMGLGIGMESKQRSPITELIN